MATNPMPYTFGTATSAIPLSQLDTNFATPVTLGNTAVYLNNTYSSIGNLTLANVTITSGTVTITNVSVTTANVSGTANISTLVVTANASVAGNVTVSGNTVVTGNVTSATHILTGGTPNGVVYLDTTKALTTGSALTFDGTNFGLSISQNAATKATLTNSNAGASASARYEANNGSNTAEFGIRGSAQTTNGVLAPQVGYVYSPSAAGLALVGASGPILFSAGGTTESMRIESATGGVGAVGIGYTSLTSVGNNGLAVLGNVGIGTSSPSYKLVVAGTAPRIVSQDTTSNYITVLRGGNTLGYVGTESNIPFAIVTNGNTAATFDTSGNLGLGVTPSAWGGTYKALQVGNGSVITYGSASNTSLYANAYRNSSDNPIYINSSYATQYQMASGQHIWYTAASGTAGNAITFTQAMTLDTSGNLGIGETSPSTFGKLVVKSGTINLVTDTATQRRLSFWSTSNGNSENAYIQVQNDGATTNTGEISLATRNSGGTLAERARIDASGNLLVGDTSAYSGSRLSVKTGNNNGTTHAWYAKNSSATVLGYQRDDGLFNTGAATNSPYNFTTASAANLFVDSSGTFYRSTSSLKYKTDVQDATHGLAEVLSLRPVTYRGKNDGETIFGGLIAEEVDAAGLTEFVQYAEDGTPDALAYGNMVSLCIKAIQQQQAIIQSLTARITALEGT